MVAQAATPDSGQRAACSEIVPVPTTVFAVIDETVSAVIDRLVWMDEQDETEGEDEAHFQAYVRWRVALINDAVLLVQALLAGENPTQSAWRQTQGRA
jgi:hypothetical protein